MIAALMRLRYVAAVIVAVVVVQVFILVALGTLRTVFAVQALLQGPPYEGPNRPGVFLVESVDLFLMALVFLILALGIAQLFLSRDQAAAHASLPPWMRIERFSELKMLLWESVVLTLVVAFVSVVAADVGRLDWRTLVLPGSILLLSLGHYLMQLRSGPRP